MPLNADPATAVPILPKIQGSLPGFMVEAEHPVVEDLLQEDNEATKIPEAKSNEKSDLDIVRSMEAYRLSNNSPQTSLKQRVQVDDITVGAIDIEFEHIVNSTTKAFTMPVLHGAPIENDIGTEWYTVEDLKANFKLHWPPVHSDGSQYSDRLEH